MNRSREEVEATLQIAKLNVEDLRSTVQCLTFSEMFTSGDYSLMELDDTLCKEIEAGGSLVIRGDKMDHAVLCSQNKTYDLKIADTSNLLLFIPDGKTPDLLPGDQLPLSITPCEIAGFSNHYWELRRSRPKLKKLKKLLLENPYEGPENEKDTSASVYMTEDLLNQIQASHEELLEHLKVLHACNVKGFWRLLDFDYEMKLLNHITQLMDSESWSFSRVPLKVCLEELRPLEPEEMIEHCLECFGKRFSEEVLVVTGISKMMYTRRNFFSPELDTLGGRAERRSVFALDEDKICRATAQMLLQNAVKFNLSEFQEVWQQSVLEGMTTRLDQLRGLALVDRTSRPETIFLLKTEDLPEDTQERFNTLFGMREKWTEADISPYIQDLCGEKQTIGALLTKYARSSLQNGVKVFNSRRPIS